MKKWICAATCLLASSAMAQMPGTDIWVADLSIDNGKLAISQMQNKTNRPGYDNQPSFLPVGTTMFYTSSRPGGYEEGSEQTDVMFMHLKEEHTENLTNSKVSEYSPTFMPHGKWYSVIHVADDGKQKFWAINLNGEERQELLTDVEPVGYHAWVDKNRVILFVLGEPHTLQLANVDTQKTQVVDDNIGASLYRIPGSEWMSYSKSEGEGDAMRWKVRRYHADENKIEDLAYLPKGAYYYAWTPDGKLIAASGTDLWQWDSKTQALHDSWQKFADLSETCPAGASRLAVNGKMDTIAIVCNRSE